MKFITRTVIARSAVLLVLTLSFANVVMSQSYDSVEKSRMKSMLGIVKDEVKKNYYDPTYHGIDLDTRFKKAEEKLAQATSTGQALGTIAQVLIDFNDSHLFLVPPATNLAVEYGWRMKAIGDKVFITDVKPGSDAEAKGVKAGDQVLGVSGFRPSRSELWKVLYYYNAISKRDRLVLRVASPGAETTRDVEVLSQLKRLPRAITFTTYFRMFDDFYEEENDKHRFFKVGSSVIWRMPGFDFDPSQVDSLMERVKGGSSLILDLRGNGGGYVKTLERLSGYFFDKDLKIADLQGRKAMDPIMSKTRGKDVYNGKLIVLLDSGSASASEIFARLVQLEKRGIVVGDTSAGSVMQSRSIDREMGTNSIVMFAVSVTNADVLMSDNKSIEHIGVIPDEPIVPTGADLAAGRDPVMAKAVELSGGKISAEEAGSFYKYYWKKD